MQSLYANDPVDMKVLDYLVVSVNSVREFAARLGNRASLEVFEDAGQLILHHDPERVLDALQEAMQK